MQLLNELLFADILRLSKDPQAPGVTPIYDIEARFSDLNINDLLFHFEARDLGPVGSQEVHDVFFQINKKLEPKRWATGHQLEKIRNNKAALRAFLINGFFLHGHVSYFCSCDAFSFFGKAYIATKNKSFIETPTSNKKEIRAPVVRNPQQKGCLCKHLIGITTNIKSFYEQILTQLQQAAKGQKTFKQFLNNDDEWTTIKVNMHKINVKEWEKEIEEIGLQQGEQQYSTEITDETSEENF